MSFSGTVGLMAFFLLVGMNWHCQGVLVASCCGPLRVAAGGAVGARQALRQVEALETLVRMVAAIEAYRWEGGRSPNPSLYGRP